MWSIHQSTSLSTIPVHKLQGVVENNVDQELEPDVSWQRSSPPHTKGPAGSLDCQKCQRASRALIDFPSTTWIMKEKKKWIYINRKNLWVAEPAIRWASPPERLCFLHICSLWAWTFLFLYICPFFFYIFAWTSWFSRKDDGSLRNNADSHTTSEIRIQF